MLERTIAGRPKTYRFTVPLRRAIHQHLPSAIRNDNVDEQTAYFDIIGELDDRRLVYGQREAQLRPWDVRLDVVCDDNDPDGKQLAALLIARWQRANTRQPSVILTTRIEPLRDGRRRYLYVGVGRDL